MYYVIRINKGISMHSIHTAQLVITLGLCPIELAVDSERIQACFKSKEENLILRISIAMILGAVTYYYTSSGKCEILA